MKTSTTRYIAKPGRVPSARSHRLPKPKPEPERIDVAKEDESEPIRTAKCDLAAGFEFIDGKIVRVK